MLPEHVDLICEITSALRLARPAPRATITPFVASCRCSANCSASQGLAEAELGALISIDQIYDIQGSALDFDVQNTMARILEFCSDHHDKLAARCAKAVALLELVQGRRATSRPTRQAGRPVPPRPPRSRQSGQRGHRGPRGPASRRPPQLRREDRLQDPVDRRRGVGPRAPRDRHRPRDRRRSHPGGPQVPHGHAGPPAPR